MTNLYRAIKSDRGFIEKILRNALSYEGWSLQGFGMLRLYLTKEVRLHVWDSRFSTRDVSLMHDHPWDFSSYVVAGQISNKRYEVVTSNFLGDCYLVSTIKCGPGGGVRSPAEPIRLVQTKVEDIMAGNEYHQKADEIHASFPADGTVTVVERTFRPDTEHARVFWSIHKSWVSAEPRPAEEEEVEAICHRALARHF